MNLLEGCIIVPFLEGCLGDDSGLALSLGAVSFQVLEYHALDVFPQCLYLTRRQFAGRVKSIVTVNLAVFLLQAAAARNAQHLLVRERGYLGWLVGTHIDIGSVALSGSYKQRQLTVQ